MEARPRILIVDDDDSVRFTTEALLSDDYDVVSAATGEVGLVLLQRAPTRLVIADLGLRGGGMSGLELLRAVPPNVGRMLITGHRDYFKRAEPRDAAIRVVFKPFAADKLLLAVENELARHEMTRTMSTLRAVGAALPVGRKAGET